jgi:hypothetical protein
MTLLHLVPSPTPVRLRCSKCGTAEIDAACNCGAPYEPIEIAKTYAKENPSASIRKIARETGTSHATAQRAKAGVSGDTPTKGNDGKQYPARQKPRQDEPKPAANMIQGEVSVEERRTQMESLDDGHKDKPLPAPSKKLKAIAALPVNDTLEALAHAVIKRLGITRAIKVARLILQLTGCGGAS